MQIKISNPRPDRTCSVLFSTWFSVEKVVWGGLLLLMFLLGSGHCVAQPRTLPTQEYYISLARFYDADYRDSGQDFRRAQRGAYRFGNTRFLDSVCYWTMLGECNYHMGNYAEAINLYEQALRLYADYNDDSWQSRIQNSAISVQASTTAVAQARITWGAPRIQGVARLPRVFQVFFGDVGGVQRALQQGGVARQPELRQVDVSEIMRCVALCLHRRRVIKGPTAKYDPLSSRLVRSLNSGALGDGSVMGSYNGVCLAIAHASMEDWDKASALLKRSILLSGGLQHPLTPVGQLEAAYIGLAINNDAAASKLALEASYSAAVFDQFDLVAESLTLATTAHLKTNRSAFIPLRNVIGWANSNNANLLHATAIVRLAESLSEAGEFLASQELLQGINRVINRRNTLAQSVIGARLKFVTALNHFLAADFAVGQTALAAAIDHFQTGSLWLYRVQLANDLASRPNASQRQVDQLYGALLRDPEETDWLQDPFEAIAFLATPHVASMELWFEVAISRRDYRKAFEIAETVRRHRFFASLPMGGRLMALRWIMHAPAAAINEKSLEQRKKFLNGNFVYKQNIDRATEIKKQLRQIPLVPEPESDDARSRNQLLAELASVSAAQESILASNALRREPSEMIFPPSFNEKQIREVIRPDQLAVVSLATGNGYYFFTVDQSSVQYAGFYKTRIMHRAIAGLLEGLGATDVAVDVDKINDPKWQPDAQEIADTLFTRIVPDQWDATKELVFVPDGALWYLPLEVLMPGEGDRRWMIGDKINVRYSPTASLAFGGQRPIETPTNLVVATDRLSPKTELELSTDQYNELLDPLPEAVQLPQIDSSSNLLGSQFDQLLDWTYIKADRNSALNTRLLANEKQSVDAGSVSAWMALPWGAPQHVILPGYQSPGITLKGRGVGNDMFLLTTGVIAAGSRTVLISRWNTAGKTSLLLTGHYAAKLKEMGVHAALAAGREQVKTTEVDYANEPRLRSKPDDAKIKGEHPYFWATHMLIGVPDESEPKIGSGIGGPNRLPGSSLQGGPENNELGGGAEEKAAPQPGGLLPPNGDQDNGAVIDGPPAGFGPAKLPGVGGSSNRG